MIGRILVFGDSIGQGYYDAENGGWVRLLQGDFLSNCTDNPDSHEINIVNLSVDGHTSQEVLQRIEFEASVRKNSEDMLIILAIGANDSYEKRGVRRTGEDDFSSNITKIIHAAQQFGQVMIVGLSACDESRTTPCGWDANLYYTNDRIRTYDGVLQQKAREFDLPFVPLWQVTHDAQQTTDIMPDGIHPNSKGHEIIYNEVKKKLNEVL